ncbi:glycosyl transferase family 1, partial [Oenococcus oeni]
TSDYQFAAVHIFKRNPNLKVVLWIHESYESLQKTSKNYMKLFNQGIKEADCIVCLTQDSYNYFSKLNSNCVLIPNFVHLPGNSQISDLSSRNISATSRISFFLGIKGIDVLVETAKFISSKYNITFAGSGSEKEIKKLNRIEKNEGVSNRIILEGPLHDAELLHHYVNSSLFISTSRSESFSLTILEAMSLGLPIVAFSTAGARYLLDNGKYGCIIEQGAVQEFAKRVNQLMNNDKKLLRYQRLSLKRAKDFNPTKIMEKWNRLLEKLNTVDY